MTNNAYAMGTELVAIEIQLQHIFLDPNNPRFTGSSWETIADDRIREDDVQDLTKRRLVEQYEIEKLRSNMEVNGYLPIDRVVVKKISDSDYVVLEGNRRICAAKELKRISIRDESIPQDISETVNTIPCLEYTGSDNMAAWTFQGLRHISGISDWPAFNKAKLLVTQMEQENLMLTEVGQRFGLTAYGAGQWVRGFKAFTQASEETDFVQEIDERCYPFFQELFGRSSIKLREWLNWDDSEMRFHNALRLNEFTGWLYPKPQNEETDGPLGIWEDRRLFKRDDLRRLSFAYDHDKEGFEEYRRGSADIDSIYARIVSQQYEQSVDREQEVFRSLEDCTKALKDLPFKMLGSLELFEKLSEIKTTIESIEAAKKT